MRISGRFVDCTFRSEIEQERMERGILDEVVTYVTQGDRLLVFRHTEHTEAGIQVPAGTVRRGESLAAAAMREACEETGSAEAELDLGQLLGSDRIRGEEGRAIRRYFFHIEFTGASPNVWRHFEIDPSGGVPVPIEFEFSWVSFPSGVPEWAGEQGAMLSRVGIAGREGGRASRETT